MRRSPHRFPPPAADREFFKYSREVGIPGERAHTLRIVVGITWGKAGSRR